MSSNNALLQFIHRIAASNPNDSTDEQLLVRYIDSRDESAFAAIVRRHGPLVLRVCRQVLGDPHDVEDAFQATFLILVRRARSIRSPERLASWLYGVSHRVAIRIRTKLGRLRSREKQVGELADKGALEQRFEPDEWCLVHREVNRLPEKFRLPIVLCYFQGLTRREAADRLGWTEGAIRGCLERGRELLRQRLRRHGSLFMAAFPAVGAGAALPALPDDVLASTVTAASRFGGATTHAVDGISQRVLSLVDEVSTPVLFGKLMLAAALLLVTLLIPGAWLVGQKRAPAEKNIVHEADARGGLAPDDKAPAIAQNPDKEVPAIAQNPVALDQERMQGVWKFGVCQSEWWPVWRPTTKAEYPNWRWTVKGNKMGWTGVSTGDVMVSFTIDPTKLPKQIDFTFLNGPHAGKKCRGVYKFGNGNRLWVCLEDPGSNTGRPKNFSYASSEGRSWLILDQVAKAGAFLNEQEPERLKVDKKTLESANIKSDGPALLAFFKQRTLSDTEMIQIESLIQQLGANSFAKREMAAAQLIERGQVVMPLLKKYFDHQELEIAVRAKQCAERIKESDHDTKTLLAAVRVLGRHKPKGAAAVLLEYLPFADNDTIGAEVCRTLVELALVEGAADPALVDGLKHKNPILRAAAGEALALAGDKKHAPAVWQLLEDRDILVKYRVALGLTLAENAKAIPALINLVPHLSRAQALHVEDVLLRLAGDKEPPQVTLGQTKEALERFTKGWSAWWKQHGESVNLSGLNLSGLKMLGYTLLVLPEARQIIELGRDNEIRWQISKLNVPMDVQLLPGKRVLIAEYHGGKITERERSGDIKWHYNIVGALTAQRLDNGNTFIATAKELVEVDRNKNKIFRHSFSKEQVLQAVKLADGRIVCLTNRPRVVVLNDKDKELNSFRVNIALPPPGKPYLFRLDVTPAGRVLLPHHTENKIIEYDLAGNALWELAVNQPVAAVRLPNGNTLVTTMDMPGKVIEFDRAGNEVWSYETQRPTKITRALRR